MSKSMSKNKSKRRGMQKSFSGCLRLFSRNESGARASWLYESQLARDDRAQMKTKSAWANHNWRPRVGWGVPIAWLTLCVVWSSTWLVIKIGLRDLPPISYAATRFVLAVIVLVAISTGRVRLLPRQALDYAVLAFTGVLMFAVNYGLLFWGELHVSSGLAAVLQATIPIFGMVFLVFLFVSSGLSVVLLASFPIFVMLFAHFMFPDEPLRLQKLAGALL